LEHAWPPETVSWRPRSAFTWSSVIHYAALIPFIIAFIPLAESDTLDAGLNPSRIMELGLLGCGCGIITLMALAYPAWRIRLDRRGLLILALFVGWTTCTMLWAPSAFLTIGKSFELASAAAAAAMIGAWAAVYLPQRRQMSNILALALFSAVVAMLVLNVPLRGSPVPMTAETGRPRLVLGFAHPLVGADLIALAIVAVIACPMSWLFKTPMLLFLLGPFYLTQPRGAAGGVVVAIIAMAIFRIKRNDARIVAFGMLALLAASVALAFGPQLMRILDAATPDDASTLNGRTALWDYAFQLIRARPLTGYGYYASRFLLLDLFPWAGHCHNAYLETALGTGLPGVILLIALTVHVARVAIRTSDPMLLGVAGYCYAVSMLDPLLMTPCVPMEVLLIAVMTAGATEVVHQRRTEIAFPVMQPMQTSEAMSDAFATGP